MKKVFTLGLIYAGTVIGAGFASGAELYRFFGLYGGGGFIGLGVSCILYAVLGWFVFHAAAGADSVFEILGRGVVSKGVMAVNFCFMFVLFCSMTAAAGAMGEMLWGIDDKICSLVFSVVIFLCVMGGKNDFANVNIILTPVLILFGIYVGMHILPYCGIKADMSLEKCMGAVKSGVVYVSYNILSLPAVIFPFKSYLKCDRIGIGASISGSLMMLALGLSILPCIAAYGESAKESALPMLTLAEKFGGGLCFALYAAVLFAAIFTTAAGNLFGLGEELLRGRNRICLFALTALGYIGSLMGFSRIISEIYALFGILGLFNIVFLVYNFIGTALKKRQLSKNC